MPKLIADLVRHKWYANAKILTAIRLYETAAQDRKLHEIFQYSLFMNRRYMFLAMNRHFNRDEELAGFHSALDPLIARYRETAALEMEWLSSLAENQLECLVAMTSRMPGRAPTVFTVAEAVVHSSMEFQSDRHHAWERLRSLGIKVPSPTDPSSLGWLPSFICWTKDRPAPVWPVPS
jgi:hypothetical protein